MNEVLNNIVNTILPVFIIVGITVAVDRTFKPDPRGLSQLVIYLFTPFLVLDGVANTQIEGAEAGQLITMALVTSLSVACVAWIVARLAGFDRKMESAFVLSSTLVNAGNYGIPLNKFAFGAAGEERALIFFVVTVIISNTLGVFLASRGAASTKKALLNVFRVPLPYAAALGLVINVSGATLPQPVARSVDLLGQAAIPAMLAVLGMQLSRATFRGQIRSVVMASGMRLIIAPLIAFPLALLLGVSGLTRQVSIVQASMPTAVISGVLAAEFGADSEFVTTTILFSTLMSILTLSVLLSIVM